jgi:hypothetical protein
MNLVLDNASEISVKKKTEKPLGRLAGAGRKFSLHMEMLQRKRLDCGINHVALQGEFS